MKIFATVFTLSLLLLLTGSAIAQKKTIILIRHAEKDTSPGADKVDPELSTVGAERAGRLAKAIKKYKPGAVYSTSFKRTRNTAAPVAKWRKVEVETYDPRDLKAVAAKVLAGKRKRYLIVGHNNTTPALVNIFAGEEKFKTLPESEYGKIFIVKMKNGKVKSVEEKSY